MLLGGKKESIIKQSMEVFEFEKKLAAIYEKKDDKGADKMYNRITVAELLKLCPAVSVSTLFYLLTAKTSLNLTDVNSDLVFLQS